MINDPQDKEEMWQRMISLGQESENQFQQLIQHAPDAIIVIDADGRIVVWNPMSESLFGWTADEVMGALLSETIIPPQYREQHQQGMHRFLTTGEVRVLNKTIEVTALSKNGNEFYVALTISHMADKGNRKFIAFIRDISEQKKMEEDLQVQQLLLERQNEELAQYASMASHDLKEPIRKILIFSGLLRTRGLHLTAAQHQETVEKIHATAERMNALIESIHKFSSISHEEQETVSTNPNEVLGEIMHDLDISIQRTQASIIASSLPNVMIKRLHLYQLFENLINNALKYSKPSTTPKISITAAGQDPGWVQISVQDNGIGFDNQFAQKVFQPFQRLHGSAYKGTGIGLSICKKIVDTYKGHIEASSVLGEGTRFSFTLPTK